MSELTYLTAALVLVTTYYAISTHKMAREMKAQTEIYQKEWELRIKENIRIKPVGGILRTAPVKSSIEITNYGGIGIEFVKLYIGPTVDTCKQKYSYFEEPKMYLKPYEKEIFQYGLNLPKLFPSMERKKSKPIITTSMLPISESKEILTVYFSAEFINSLNQEFIKSFKVDFDLSETLR